MRPGRGLLSEMDCRSRARIAKSPSTKVSKVSHRFAGIRLFWENYDVVFYFDGLRGAYKSEQSICLKILWQWRPGMVGVGSSVENTGSVSKRPTSLQSEASESGWFDTQRHANPQRCCEESLL